MTKYRVYTVTDNGKAGSVPVECDNEEQAISRALEYPEFVDVEDIEEFERGSINHPFHSFYNS
jgi:hypothetical protein